MFGKAKELWDLKRQADQMKKELEKELIEVEAGDIKVVISADQKIQSIRLGDTIDEKTLKEVINKALEESQKVAAKKMQDMMGGLGNISEMLKGS